MKNNSILDIQNIRRKLEDEIELTLSYILKEGGMYHYFHSMELCKKEYEGYAIDVYEETIHLLSVIENIITTYPDDYKTILSGEFKYNYSESLPLFVFLDLISSFCNNTRYILSAEEMERFQHILSIARNVEFSDKFNRNWHINDDIYKNTNSDTVIQFELWAEKDTYRDKLGRHEYNSTIQTVNRLSDCKMEVILNPNEEFINNYDFSNLPELSCDPCFIAYIRNTTYKQGSWTTEESSSMCFLFKEQKEEYEKRYEILGKKIIASEKEKRRSNFNILLPYFAKTKLNKFLLSEYIKWDENEYTKRMAQELEIVYLTAKEYFGNEERNFLYIINQDHFDDFLKEINYEMMDFTYCEKDGKREIVKELIEGYMQISNFTRTIFRIREMVREELEQTLMNLSLEELYICREKMNAKFFGFSYIKKYIN